MPEGTDDAVARYCAASEAGDIAAMMEALGPHPELVSPISGSMVFRGREDLRVLLGAVYGSLRDLRWTRRLRDGDHAVVLGEARIGGARVTDAMVFELGPDGRIARIRPHLRPWLGLTAFAVVVGPKLARHPGVIGRALR